MPPTIEDVAQRAGVSRQTVSRVINERNWVSPDARERVLAAVRELGYRRNALAGGLRSGRTQTIGLLISNIMNPLFAGEARGVQDVADAHNYQVILANTDEDVGKERRLLQMLREKQVDGAIVIPCQATSRVALGEFAGASTPVVLLNRKLPGFDNVTFDSFGEGEQAVQHLIDCGHRRIAIITSPRRSTTARERVRAYERTLKRNGIELDHDLVRAAGFGELAAHDATLALLALSRPPTAIFTSSVLLTLGTLMAIRAAGLRIPDDVALVGCNETRWSQVVDPPLTMIQTDPYALGRAGAELLFRRLEGDRSGMPESVCLPAELEVRRSSGSPAGARSLGARQRRAVAAG